GHPPEVLWTFLGTSCATILQIGIEAAGSNWNNATKVWSAMRAMNSSAPENQAFFGQVGIDDDGRNVLAKYRVVQFLNGEMKLIETADDLEFPAHWPWIGEEDDDGSGVEATVG